MSLFVADLAFSDAEFLSAAKISVLMASIIGALGSLYPAWRASRRDPYDLVRGEG